MASAPDDNQEKRSAKAADAKAISGEAIESQLTKYKVVAVAFLKQSADLFLQIVSKPVTFFARMPIEGGFKQPVIFFALIAFVNSFVTLIVSLAHDPAGGFGAAGTQFICMMLGSAIAGGIVYGLSKAFGGTGTFEGAYRAVCFSMAPAVLAWLPFVNVFACIYSIFLLKLSLERAQGLKAARATAVTGIVVGVGVALAIMMAFQGLAGLLESSHGHKQ